VVHGSQVWTHKVGPGYRVYLGQDGETLVLLLGGSSRARQSEAIADAQARWAGYKARKGQGEIERRV
jgi:putative component of toxin-antitoxin plasmid stabilization module